MEPSISFEAVTGVGRKRSAEWSLADRVAALRILVEGMAKEYHDNQQKEQCMQEEFKSLRQETKELKDILNASRQEQLAAEKTKSQDQKAHHIAFQEKHKKQGAAVQEMQTLIKEKGKRPSYSEIAKASGTHTDQPWSVVEEKDYTKAAASQGQG